MPAPLESIGCRVHHQGAVAGTSGIPGDGAGIAFMPTAARSVVEPWRFTSRNRPPSPREGRPGSYPVPESGSSSRPRIAPPLSVEDSDTGRPRRCCPGTLQVRGGEDPADSATRPARARCASRSPRSSFCTSQQADELPPTDSVSFRSASLPITSSSRIQPIPPLPPWTLP